MSNEQEPIGIIECDAVNGWHMNALVDWEKIGIGTKLYAAPVGDTGAIPSGTDAVFAEVRKSVEKDMAGFRERLLEMIPARESSGSVAWDYGNSLVDKKLNPSYAQSAESKSELTKLAKWLRGEAGRHMASVRAAKGATKDQHALTLVMWADIVEQLS